jgi:hypothetical protein
MLADQQPDQCLGKAMRFEFRNVLIDADRVAQAAGWRSDDSDECISTGMPMKRGSALDRRVSR